MTTKNEIFINASLVKELRGLTGASVMECKGALVQSKGDLEKAKTILRSRGKERASKKSDRTTSQGIISSYIHSNGKIGAMIELRCETDFVAKNSEFRELAYDLAMHVTAMSPQYISVAEIPNEIRNDFENAIRQEVEKEKKPVEIIEKIISGKAEKHFEEISLLSQSFVRDSEATVGDFIKGKISKIGENIKVERFVRYEI